MTPELLIFVFVKEHFIVQAYSILVENVPLSARGSIKWSIRPTN
jgi:hypothetical protein